MTIKYKYDTWGREKLTTGSMASTLGQKNPFRYRSYYYVNVVMLRKNIALAAE